MVSLSDALERRAKIYVRKEDQLADRKMRSIRLCNSVQFRARRALAEAKHHPSGKRSHMAETSSSGLVSSAGSDIFAYVLDSLQTFWVILRRTSMVNHSAF